MPTSQTVSAPTCDSMYGNPARTDCAAALNRLPRDSTFRYFVDQQMRIVPQAASWRPFTNSRGQYRQPVSQQPKWWSCGESYFLHSCVPFSDLSDAVTEGKPGTSNVLIMGYVNFGAGHVQKVSSAGSSW